MSVDVADPGLWLPHGEIAASRRGVNRQGRRSSKTRVGAAFQLVGQMIEPDHRHRAHLETLGPQEAWSASIRIGLLKPNRSIDAAILPTCAFGCLQAFPR